jgi:hypothetical protein
VSQQNISNKYYLEPHKAICKVLQNIKFNYRFNNEHKDYWKTLKDKYKGNRGFIIGNGPSLISSDLDKIKDEISIASNIISLIFGETSWRPNFFTVADPLVWKKISNNIHDDIDIVHIPTTLSGDSNKKTIYWKHGLSSPFGRFSKNAERKLYGGQTITFQNIQIAAHLGLNPIYLIGCDHFYAGEKNVIANQAIIQGSEQTHFSKEYRSAGEIVMSAPIHEMNFSFNQARKFLRKENIQIYNATRGGHLEIFERVDLDKVILNEPTY